MLFGAACSQITATAPACRGLGGSGEDRQFYRQLVIEQDYKCASEVSTGCSRCPDLADGPRQGSLGGGDGS